MADGQVDKLIATPGAHGLAWSPDDSLLAYASLNYTYTYVYDLYGVSSIRLIPTDGGDEIEVVSDGAMNVSPAWRPDSNGLLFISDRGGVRDIYHVTVHEGHEPGPAVRCTMGLNPHTLSLSRDGSILVYSLAVTEANVRSFTIPERVDLGREGAKVGGEFSHAAGDGWCSD